MKIQKYTEHSLYLDMCDHFFASIDSSIITESGDNTNYREVEKKVLRDLKVNMSIVGTFGAGISALYPIVNGLVKNMSLNIDLTVDKVVLLTIAAFSIIYLEEKKSKMDPKKEEILTKDSKSMLEELKMSGIGNGIVKKLIDGFKSIKNIFSIIGKHVGAVASGFIDMFAYASLVIPILNGVYAIIGKYDLTLDSICGNFLGLAVGVGTLIAKHGITDILNRIKNKIPADKSKKIIDEIESPTIQKFGDADIEQAGTLIKEEQ
jgi:hypothetical protein